MENLIWMIVGCTIGSFIGSMIANRFIDWRKRRKERRHHVAGLVVKFTDGHAPPEVADDGIPILGNTDIIKSDD